MIETYIGGIPLDFGNIHGRKNFDVQSLSGDTIHVETHPQFGVRIKAQGRKFYYCEVEPVFPEAPHLRKVSIRVSKVDEDGNKHPDFRAAQLIHASMDWLETELGGKFTGINYRWEQYSTNYKQYSERLKKELENGVALIKAQKIAALNTWTAQRIALPRGFTHVTITEDQEDEQLYSPVVFGTFS